MHMAEPSTIIAAAPTSSTSAATSALLASLLDVADGYSAAREAVQCLGGARERRWGEARRALEGGMDESAASAAGRDADGVQRVDAEAVQRVEDISGWSSLACKFLAASATGDLLAFLSAQLLALLSLLLSLLHRHHPRLHRSLLALRHRCHPHVAHMRRHLLPALRRFAVPLALALLAVLLLTAAGAMLLLRAWVLHARNGRSFLWELVAPLVSGPWWVLSWALARVNVLMRQVGITGGGDWWQEQQQQRCSFGSAAQASSSNGWFGWSSHPRQHYYYRTRWPVDG
eukprot:TRINITY_DN5173_c0_g1_i1.p1 TRINITY_DN5173_c0_g1~~TRINITY_DN5173_c0_g1_i1.p1  ORF type:complete len:287 (+),score=-7.55 TRINITY_DN5173_c0_g1_i1:2-862(+)